MSSSSPLARAVRRSGDSVLRAIRETETTWLVILAALSLLLMALQLKFVDWWPLSSYVIPLVLAINVLSIGRLLLLDLVVTGCLIVSIMDVGHLTSLRKAGVVVIVVVMLLGIWFAYDRQQLGV